MMASFDEFIYIYIYISQPIFSCCPLSGDCQWSSYGEWSECSEPCEGGKRTSNRTINQPAIYGGMDCIGNDTRIETCNLNLCPGTPRMKIPLNLSIENNINKNNCSIV